MPWHIARSAQCPSGRPWAVIKDADGTIEGCHETQGAAQDQLAALNASENSSKEHIVADVERRYTKVAVEVRADKERHRIGGYAAVFNRESRNLGGFVETVDPHAFDGSRGDGWPDVIARYNHDDNMLLGSTAGGTLRLAIDGVGLDYDVEPPQSRADIIELVNRGDVAKSSFAFRVVGDDGEQWQLNDQDFPQRRLMRLQLVDVAPVNMPAYPDATAGLRALARHMQADLDEVRKLIQQGEVRRLFRRSDGASAQNTLGAAARMAVLARERDPYDVA